jgi:F-type H+-transporting ATPase subunit alpha
MDFIYEGGSLTAFPIIETIQGDVSAYIPTNVISITDGQIYLEMDLFNSGIRPAISPGISVSRIGGAAQSKVIRTLAGPLKLELAQFREMEDFVRLGFALDAASARLMDRGAKLMKLMTQPYGQPLPIASQILLLFGGLNGFFEDLDINEMPEFEEQFLCFFHKSSFFKPLMGVARMNLKFDIVIVNYIINIFKLFYQEKKGIRK